jgi:rod shape-determining protein MreD
VIHVNRVIFFFLLLVAQFSLLPRLHLGVFAPDLLLGMTLILSLFHGLEAGCITGLIAGILSDANMSMLLGARAFSWTQAALAIGLISDKLLIENAFVQMLVVFNGSILAGVFHLLFYRILSVEESIWHALASVFCQAAVTGILAIPMVHLLVWLKLVPRQRHD